MSIEAYPGPSPVAAEIGQTLRVPHSLRPETGAFLPDLSRDTLAELAQYGWQRIGIMVAIVDTDGRILMQNHNGRDKNTHSALGPLGETSSQSHPYIEQPLWTLYRGIIEELGVDNPDELGLLMHAQGGWTVNQWPRGMKYPGEFACALSIPVFLDDYGKRTLTRAFTKTQEVNDYSFMHPADILQTDDLLLRPGVKPWLQQIESTELLDPFSRGNLQRLTFYEMYQAQDNVYGPILKDIDLQCS